MYRVAAWDDNGIHLEALCDLTEVILRERGIEFSVQRFTVQDELLKAIKTGPPYDLLLLDILNDGPEGMELAAQLRSQGMESSIIFVSSSPDYLLNGYDVHAVNYILKPPDRQKLGDAIDYALRHRPVSRELIALTCVDGIRSVSQGQVLYLESRLHYTQLHLDTGEALSVRGKLEEVAAQLPGVPFARCHKSLMVSLSRVRSVQGYELELNTGGRLPISRSRAKDFKQAYLAYKVY